MFSCLGGNNVEVILEIWMYLAACKLFVLLRLRVAVDLVAFALSDVSFTIFLFGTMKHSLREAVYSCAYFEFKAYFYRQTM
jgi:hypothetical protein